MLQMTSTIDPVENGEQVAQAAKTAAKEGAAMLFAPEMAGLIDRNRTRAASSITSEHDSVYLEIVAKAASENGIWIHAGSLPVTSDQPGGRWRNRSIVFNSEGKICGRYDKIHLFDVDLPTGESWRESAAYDAGDQAVVIDTPVGKLGLTICYDLRFPELFVALATAGAQIITVPAAFTVPTGIAHWHVLLRARAIETGSWIVAPAQYGLHADGRETYGHSLVIDPWGNICHDAGQGVKLSTIDIDLEEVSTSRGRIPTLQHRRPFQLP